MITFRFTWTWWHLYAFKGVRYWVHIEFKNTEKKIVATESEGVRNSICCHVHQVKMKVAGVILWSRVGIFMLLNTLKGFSTTPTTSAHTFPKIRIFLNFQSCFPGPLWISGVGKILVETFYLLIAENLLVYVRTYFGEICFSFNERSCECVCVCVHVRKFTHAWTLRACQTHCWKIPLQFSLSKLAENFQISGPPTSPRRRKLSTHVSGTFKRI